MKRRKQGSGIWGGLAMSVAVGLLVAAMFFVGLWIRDAMFEFVYGDAARELIREMVKPEALKADPK